jgi:hypothetical protein
MPEFMNLSFNLDGPCHPVTEAELLAAEAKLSCRFPQDYRDFIRAFGAGWFDLISLRVFSPSYIVKTTERDQQRLRQYWFWNDSPDVWTQAQACRSVACFDSPSGHDIRFSPEDPSALYVLVHDVSTIKRVGSFAELVDFLRTFERSYEDDEDAPTYETFSPS